MKLANEAAFPVAAGSNGWNVEPEPGLTKREYIAVKCLAAICEESYSSGLTCEEIASDAVRYADALLAELAKGPKS